MCLNVVVPANLQSFADRERHGNMRYLPSSFVCTALKPSGDGQAKGLYHFGFGIDWQSACHRYDVHGLMIGRDKHTLRKHATQILSCIYLSSKLSGAPWEAVVVFC